jgi:hypothetical protein
VRLAVGLREPVAVDDRLAVLGQVAEDLDGVVRAVDDEDAGQAPGQQLARGDGVPQDLGHAHGRLDEPDRTLQKRNRARLGRLEAALSPTPVLPPPGPEREEMAVLGIAKMCAEVYGPEDRRASAEYLRTLTRDERLDVYAEAAEHNARLWGESPEGQAFAVLPYAEKIALLQRAAREGTDIAAAQGMRLHLRETRGWKQ